ncbi:MAG: hypothetical protein ABJA66_12035 [Actinomycetota bacterium]
MKPLSEEQHRAYFLGELPAAEAENFEENCAAHADLTEQAQMIERELADDYLRGNLSPAEVHLFETNYLITEARRKKLLVAEGLWKIAGEQKAEENLAAAASPNSFWQTIFGKRKRFQLAFTCLILLLVFGSIAFYLLPLNVGKDEVAEVRIANQPTPKIENSVIQNDEPSNQNPKAGAANSVIQNKEANKKLTLPQKTQPEVKTISTPKISEQRLPKAPSFATFLLFSGTLRDEGEQFITIAPNIKSVNLLLNLPAEAGEYKIYRVFLKTADGDTIYTSPNLKSLSFSFPAEKLENRTYLIYLEGQNPPSDFESISEYTFHVRR